MAEHKRKLDWLDAMSVVLPQLPLVPEVRGRHYRYQPNPLAGCCLVASEAIYHLTEIDQDKLTLHYFRYGQKPWQTHYFLRENNAVIDATASQFDANTLERCYNFSVRRGMTKIPSRRAQIILDRIDRDVYFRDT